MFSRGMALITQVGSLPAKPRLLSFIMGANTQDGAGNITLFGSYEDQEELLGADRDTGACTLGGTSTINCVGSSNFRRFNGTLGCRRYWNNVSTGRWDSY